MIIAEKIMSLRKQYGWSQEELADLIGVSRQSVSKWESAASIPDIQKIIKMSEVFGVSIDYLLKDEIDLPETSQVEKTSDIGADSESSVKSVSLEEANDYLDATHKQALRTARAVALFIILPGLYIAVGEMNGDHGESFIYSPLLMIAFAAMLILIGIGVAMLIKSHFSMSKYEYLSKEEIKLGYGVEAAVKRRYAPVQEVMGHSIAVGVFLCIVGLLPVFVFNMGGQFRTEIAVMAIPLTLMMVAIAVHTFVRVGIINGGYKKLLQEGDYTPENKRAEERMAPFAGAYWTAVTDIYMIQSFLLGNWGRSWVVWPIAGVLFGFIYTVYEAYIKKKDSDKKGY